MHVRGLLDKMLHSVDNSPQNKKTAFPVLPPSLSLEFVQKSSILGWMANRMGEFLSLSKQERDSLFFFAFYMERGSDQNELLALSELMIRWHQRGENVPEKIKHERLPHALETAFLNVYREYQDYYKNQEAAIRENLHSSVNSEFVSAASSAPNVNISMWGVYRDVMYAATQRKFLLISDDEIDVNMQGTILLEQEVKERTDITVCREKTKGIFQQLGLEPATIMSWQLVISEAVTNILKHAEHGRMLVAECEEEIRVIIKDKGPGFSLNDLPNTVLIAGYSTKKSLGQGFTLMMKMTDQVLLNTTPNGSTIILIFKKAGQRK